MPYLLNLLYVALLVAVSPWLLYQAIRNGKYRQGFAEKFLGRVPVRRGDRCCVWLHAVSVGEVNLLSTVLEEWARQRPEWECVISTTTITGYALARKKYPSTQVFYCPLDFSWAVSTALARVRPELLLLAELELWPNLIRAARRQGVGVAVMNGRLSEKSFRGYRRLRWLLAPTLRQLDLVAAQNEEYAQRFRALGVPPAAVHVTGSIKYDGAQSNRTNPETLRLRKLAGFAPRDLVFLAGSTQAPEESLALATFRELSAAHPRLRLVVVPRHAERFAEVAALIERSGLAFDRRSHLDQRPFNPAARVLLVDAIGELGAWWGTAQVAFVGGSMGARGGQNMIEPAAYGAAVCFGPNTRNFRDIVASLLSAGAAEVVRDGRELTSFVHRTLSDSAYASLLSRRAQTLVAHGQGATARTVALLLTLADDHRGQQPSRFAA